MTDLASAWGRHASRGAKKSLMKWPCGTCAALGHRVRGRAWCSTRAKGERHGSASPKRLASLVLRLAVDRSTAGVEPGTGRDRPVPVHRQRLQPHREHPELAPANAVRSDN